MKKIISRQINRSLAVALTLGAWTFVACAQAPGNALIPDPAWDCYLPDGIPNPEDGDLIFEMEIPLERAEAVGRTPYGDRSIAVGLTGSVAGRRLSGAVMEGALDYELILSNGTVEIEQILVLQADDGSYIYVRNAGTGPDQADVRVVLDFEAPNESDHAWLNSGTYVARRQLDPVTRTLVMRVYDVGSVRIDPARATRVSKPSGWPPQPWDYRRKSASEQQGDMLIVENVTLAASQSVGASKRGNRNIIPISGGELSGQITGKVLMGGADYQNLSAQPAIDARYLWQADDGEIIIVRNAGGFGGLVPTFEARIDGPYAYLNEGLYLSSNPGMGQGGVSLTFYKSVE